MRASFSSRNYQRQPRSISSILGIKNVSSCRPSLIPKNSPNKIESSNLPSLTNLCDHSLKSTSSSAVALRSPNSKDVDPAITRTIDNLNPELKKISEFSTTLESKTIFMYTPESTTMHLLQIISQVLFKIPKDLSLEDQYGDFSLAIADDNFNDVKNVIELLCSILTHGAKEIITTWLQTDNNIGKIVNILLYADPREVHLGELLVLTVYKNYPQMQKRLLGASFKIITDFLNGYKSFHGINTVIRLIDMHYRSNNQQWTSTDSQVIKEFFIPLLNHQFSYRYYSVLNQLLIFSYTKDPRLGKFILQHILRFWPTMNSKKTACYVNHILSIANTVGSVYIDECVPEMFFKLISAVRNESPKVALEAIKGVGDINFIFEYMGHYPTYVKELFDAIGSNNTHWCIEVQEASKKTAELITNSLPNIKNIRTCAKEPSDASQTWESISLVAGVGITGSL